LNTPALPNLVSFNLKDGTLNAAYLQQLLGANGNIAAGLGLGNRDNKSGNDTSNLSMPMPTPFNFGQQQGQLAGVQGQQAPVTQQTQQATMAQGQPKNDANKSAIGPAPVAGTHGQQAQQCQPQMVLGNAANNRQQQTQQQLVGATTNTQQQVLVPQQQQQQQVQIQQQPPLAQAAAVQQNLAQQGAFSLFQQGALLAQQTQNAKQQPLTIRPTIPSIMLPNISQQQPSHEQISGQQAVPQFTFTSDPNAFLRQLQVAQLQQQFNAVQQARPMPQQVMGAAPQVAPQALQQQIAFQQPQVPMVAATVATAQPPAPVAKKGRPSQKKAPPNTRGKGAAKQAVESARARKAPVVSASDTDGELSSKFGPPGVKGSKKSAALTAAALKADEESVDMSNMTPAEKAKANRDRNREHARNTRLRKKAYLEKLKTTVDDLCKERDTLVSERAGAANILVEMHNTRTEVLMSFFALRSANEKRRDLWASILDESCFACVVPVTPYRSFPASEVQVSKCQRTILGIDGMMSDTASLHVLFNSLVDRSRFPNATINFRYTLVTEEAAVAGNQFMARWVMTTLNATQCGARMEVAKQGMLCCKFNSAHKIIGLELMFDVMALMLQLKQAEGSDTFSVIPNTVQTCQRSFDKPMVMTLAEEPYTIVQVNKLWEEMTGYKAEEVVGKASCRTLEGEETDPSAVEGLMNEARFKRPASGMVVNYKKTGEPFRNFFLAFPLSTDSRITHYLQLSAHVDTVMGGPPAHQALTAQGNQIISQEPSVADSPFPVATTNESQQPNFLGTIQSLQAAVGGSGQGPLGRPNAQSIYGIQPVLSNGLAAASIPGAMLPPAIGAPQNIMMQQYSLDTLKRGGSEQAAGITRKQARSGEAGDASKSI
jgi:PAS domain S-box-containing protein